jgi:hypothetical protein
MRQNLRSLFAVAAVLALLCPAGLLAQTSDVDQKIKSLEAEIQKLNAEVAAMKQSAAPAPVANAAVATPSEAAAPAAKPAPLAGLASVLGGATVTGLVDGYYGFNANTPATNISTTNRVFDPTSNQFSLNLIELGLVKTPDADSRLGYNLTFGFGPAMDAINKSNDPSSSFAAEYIKEGYLSYLAPVGKGLQIDFGKFVTPMGAEVIESNANWNYSRSLLFYYAIPYYHFGGRAKYTFNDKYSLTGYVVNGWNDILHAEAPTPQTTTNSYLYNNSGKTGGLSFAWTPNKKWAVTETWLGGPGAVQTDGNHWRDVFDTVISYNVTPKLTLQTNGDYGRVEGTLAQDVDNAALITSGLKPLPNKSVEYFGVAGYAKYQFNPLYAFATRYEYFDDPDGIATPFGTSYDPNGLRGPHMQEVTATFERKIATHLITRAEYRYDTANQSLFPKNSNKFISDQSTVTAGMIFVLEPSETK